MGKIKGILGAVALAGIATLTGGSFALFGFAFEGFSAFLVRAALGVALNALTPKPKSQGANRGYQVTTKGSALDHQIIYGRMRVGGVIVHDETTGSENRFLHRVIAFAGHEVESFDEIYLNEEFVEVGGINYTVEVTGEMQVPGTEGDTVTETKTVLVNAVRTVDAVHEVSDNLTQNEFNILLQSAASFTDVDGNPINVGFIEFTSATVLTKVENPDKVIAGSKWRGKVRINTHLGNPDDTLADQDLVAESEAGWSQQHRLRGIAYMYVRLEFDSDIFPNGIPEITATISGKKVFDPRSGLTAWSDNPALCIRDYLTARYGLSEVDDAIDDAKVTQAANSCDRIADNGEKWFTCNGAFVTQITPYDILNDLLTSMGGLLWYAQGQWRMKAAEYVAPTLTFNEDDLRGPIGLKTRQSRRDNYNTIKGTFRGEESNWQVTDYPEVTKQVFIDVDGGQESVLDLELPFTDNSEEARRIARIALERNRQQLTVSAAFGLRAFQVQVGDIVKLSVERFGWTEKEFEVSSWTFGLTGGLDLQVNMSLREISENVFDEVADGLVFERDNTTLLSPFAVPALGLTVNAVAKNIREKLLNTLEVIVTAQETGRIDYVEVQYKDALVDQWDTLGVGQLGRFCVVDVEPSYYDVRVRAVNTFGVKGSWVTRENVRIDSLFGPPSDVTSFRYTVGDSTLSFYWDAVPEGDLSHYVIRFSSDTSTASWANSVVETEKIPRPATSTTVPLRAGTFLIKAVDKTGIASSVAATVTVAEEVLPSFTTTSTLDYHPTFPGAYLNLTVDGSDRLRLQEVQSDASFGVLVVSGLGGYIDAGSAKRAWVEVVGPNVRLDETAGLFDDFPKTFDEAPGLFDSANSNLMSDTTIRFSIDVTTDDPAGTPTWTAVNRVTAGYVYGRAFRLRSLRMDTDHKDTSPSLQTLNLVVKYD